MSRIMFFNVFVILYLVSLCGAQDPVRPYPLPASYNQSTSFLNHSSYISSFDESQWYLDNIPFVDFPDQSLQDVYYYRTTVIKRHLKYTQQGHGWSFTEFIQPVAWGTMPNASYPFSLITDSLKQASFRRYQTLLRIIWSKPDG